MPVDPQKYIVAFGKYQGQPLSSLLEDERYMFWFMSEPGLPEKYPVVRDAILERPFSRPSTHAHNAFQADFLNDDLCRRLLALLGVHRERPCLDRWFELDNWDLVLRLWDSKLVEPPRTSMLSVDNVLRLFRLRPAPVSRHEYWERILGIEVKTSIGDDYPEVLRTILRRVEISHSKYMLQNLLPVVIVRSANFRDVTFTQVRRIYFESGVSLLRECELEMVADFDDLLDLDVAETI